MFYVLASGIEGNVNLCECISLKSGGQEGKLLYRPGRWFQQQGKERPDLYYIYEWYGGKGFPQRQADAWL